MHTSAGSAATLFGYKGLKYAYVWLRLRKMCMRQTDRGG